MDLVALTSRSLARATALCADPAVERHPLAHARPVPCHVLIGNESSFGGFEPVNQYSPQAEGFSRHLLGDDVPVWPIEDAASELQLIEALFESGRTGGWVSTTYGGPR